MDLMIIIAFLAAFVLQGVIILGAIKLSLKWQIQVKNNVIPTVDNPIKQIIEEKKIEQKVKEYKNAFDEYINGDPDKEGE